MRALFETDASRSRISVRGGSRKPDRVDRIDVWSDPGCIGDRGKSKLPATLLWVEHDCVSGIDCRGPVKEIRRRRVTIGRQRTRWRWRPSPFGNLNGDVVDVSHFLNLSPRLEFPWPENSGRRRSG